MPDKEGFRTKVGSRGRVVIPKNVRRSKKIREDDKVRLEVQKLDFEPKEEGSDRKGKSEGKERKQPGRRTNYNVFR